MDTRRPIRTSISPTFLLQQAKCYVTSIVQAMAERGEFVSVPTEPNMGVPFSYGARCTVLRTPNRRYNVS